MFILLAQKPYIEPYLFSVSPNIPEIDVVEPPKSPTGVPENENKKRPRLDFGAGRERKRGKSMFGILVGTLNKAKIEDKERNASEAVSILFFWTRIFPKKKKKTNEWS